MRVFVTVVDGSSFTGAASALGLSQATVSGHVAQLEKRIGARLVERTTRSVRLTDEGARYYALCQRVLGDIDDTETALAQAHDVPAGRLRVDATVALICHLLLPVLPEFNARYPNIRVEFHHTDALFDDQPRNFDVMFRVGDLAEADLVARPISPLRLVVAASTAYLEKRGRPQHPEDLREHDCIGFIDPLTKRLVPWIFEREGMRLSVPVCGYLACNEGVSRIAAARAGLGIVLTHAYELSDDLRTGMMEVLLSAWSSPASHFAMTYPRNRYLPAKTRVFVDFVSEKYPVNRLLDVC